ncbi:MAG: DUF885 family protein [Candidatus Acidiferrales bacterium]
MARRIALTNARPLLILSMLMVGAVLAVFVPFSPASPPALGHALESGSSVETVPPANLLKLSDDFWKWRAQYQPFSSDDIPRIDRPTGPRDWSAAGIAKQRAGLAEFKKRWKVIGTRGWTVPAQVDYRLIGSAIARVHWELDVNARWQRDPTFYIDQTLGALVGALLPPPPFDLSRAQVIRERMDQIPAILRDAKANLRPLRPFAELAISSLTDIRLKLSRSASAVAPLLPEMLKIDAPSPNFAASTKEAIAALEDYRAWLQSNLASMPTEAAIGRDKYEYFLRNVALIPYTPGEMLQLSRQEWARSVAFETYEKDRDRGVPVMTMAATTEEEVARGKRDEFAIRKFLEANRILSVPPQIPHYELRAMPDYLVPLSDFTEMDDFAGLSRMNDPGVRWIEPPSPNLGYFWLAETKDARPDIVHEGVPGHFFQMSLSRRNPDPIRREYYDSGANEGIGFYSEEVMLQHGLFDDSPHTREIIYNFMRLRALRVEVDVKLALGEFTLDQAADYLATHVPMDAKTAHGEAAFFASTPGQAITYQVGKSQILAFLADARTKQGDKFHLLQFNDALWSNGNVPIVLQRWEYLGDDSELRVMDSRRDGSATH